MMSETYYKGAQLALINFAIGLGTFVQILDSSIANVAIPYIAGNLGVSTDNGTWVITAFAASNAVVLPLTGWLSDYFGRVKLFVWSVLLFGIISFCCGFSHNLSTLVFFRILQGAVAGSLIPLSQTLIVSSNSDETRGIALGFWAMIVVVAPILGPIIGGYFTEVYSWPWIFYINVPICAFSAAIVWIYLRKDETKIVRNPIDWTGLCLLSLGVASLQIMLDKGEDLDWFRSNIIIALTITSAIALCYFIIWNNYQKYRIVDFSFFKNRNFFFGTIAITIGYLVYFATTVTIPLWLQTEQNYTPFWAGIAVAPVGIAPFFLSAIVGKYMDRIDVRYLPVISFSLFAVGFFYQATFTTQIDLYHLMLARLMQGLGVAFFFLPLVQISLGNIAKESYAKASGLFHFIRILIGSGFGTSLTLALWNRLEIFHYARLTESLTAFNTTTAEFYHGLEAYNPIYSSEVVNRLLDRMVQQQAYMLSTNDISWLGAWLFILMIPIAFLCKKVEVSHNPGPAGAH